MTSYRPVDATLRGLEVLRAVSRMGSCTVKDIHREIGLNRPTVVRMLETLIHAGYVYREEQPGRYALTARTLALSAGYRPSAEVAHHATPILARLQQQIGWPCDAAICDGLEMVTVATSPPAGRLPVNQPAGFRFSILGSSMGLAYIAFAGEREREAALQGLARNPDPWNEIARDPTLAERTFAAILRRGYAIIDRRAAIKNYHGALEIIGAPVLVDGVSVAAMNVIFLSEAAPLRTALKQFVGPLQAAAAELGAAIAAARAEGTPRSSDSYRR